MFEKMCIKSFEDLFTNFQKEDLLFLSSLISVSNSGFPFLPQTHFPKPLVHQSVWFLRSKVLIKFPLSLF